MALIGYARVSTKDQSLDAQLDKLKSAGCEKIFYGKQSGKSSSNQDKIDELVGYCREGDVVVLTKLDRLGRSLNKILQTVESLRIKGVSLKTLDGQVDTASNNPMAKAMMQLLGVFAELEHSTIVDRVQTGRQLTQRKGGRPSKLDSKQVQKVKELFSRGESKSQLAARFEVSRQTIKRIVEG